MKHRPFLLPALSFAVAALVAAAAEPWIPCRIEVVEKGSGWPVPLSPRIKTDVSTRATLEACLSIIWVLRLRVRKLRLRRVFKPRDRSMMRRWRITSSTTLHNASGSNGLVRKSFMRA